MAITISGENNNDRILASDGVIDSLSGFNVVGVITATSFTGDLTGNVTGNVVGNLTGNVNHTSNLLLQIGGSEKFRVASSGQLGIGGANYGTSGQVLTSGGSGSAASWTTIAAQANISNNADNRVITGGSGVNLNGEATLTFDGSTLNNTNGGANFTKSGNNYILVGSTNASGASLVLDGDSNGDGSGTDYAFLTHNTDGDLDIVVDNPANAGNIKFFTNSSVERLRITSDGKIGIGHHIGSQITKELTIRPADGGGILMGRPGDTVAPINVALQITTRTSGSEAYHTEYHTSNCNAMFSTHEGGGTGGNIIFQTGVGNGNDVERLRIKSNGQILYQSNSGDNQFTSKRTGLAGSNGDYFFHFNAVNNTDVTVGNFGFYRDTAADDSRFSIRTRNTGGSSQDRLRIDSSGRTSISKNGWAGSDMTFGLTVHTGATSETGPVNDGIMIVSQQNSGNQNSSTGKLMFCGHGQTNGPFLYGDSELSYGKKGLVFHTLSTANSYSTQLEETARFNYQGRFGLGTGTAVDSLMHIQGNSDSGGEYCQLTIEDEDTTAGSQIPSIQFKGNGTNTWRVRGTDLSGFQFHQWNGSSQIGRSTIGNPSEGGAFLLNADDRGWATFRHNHNQGLRTHIRRHYSPGNAVQTYTILRIRRHWWGWGTYKITCKALYYNSSLESVYYVNGHLSGGNHISVVKQTFGGDASNQDWSCTVTHTASNNAPGTNSTWYADIKVNIPNYYYVTIVIEAFSSQYSTDPNNLGIDSYCLM